VGGIPHAYDKAVSSVLESNEKLRRPTESREPRQISVSNDNSSNDLLPPQSRSEAIGFGLSPSMALWIFQPSLSLLSIPYHSFPPTVLPDLNLRCRLAQPTLQLSSNYTFAFGIVPKGTNTMITSNSSRREYWHCGT